MKLKLTRTVVAACVTGTLVLCTATAAQADPASDFISRTNGLRSSRSVAGLAVNGQLTAMAQSWASHMASTQQLAHNPNLAGQAPSNWIKLGENVGEGPSVDAIHQAFVNSPEHYRNLVDSSFQYIGVAVVTDNSGTLWVVEDFMQTSSAPPPPPPPYVPRSHPTPVVYAAPAKPSSAESAPAAAPPPVPTTTTVPTPSLAQVVASFRHLDASS